MASNLDSMKKSIFLFSLLALLAACNRNKEEQALRAALQDAGPNKGQLQKVLDHYPAPSDSLKLKAARFLIANMPYHYGYYGEQIDTYGQIFSLIDTLYYRQENVTVKDKMHIGDSLLKIYGPPNADLAKKIPDTKLISADYLISNIDFAFNAWNTAPWRKKVNFADFCDFILPYRIRNEQLQYWRPPCYYQYTRLARHYQYPDSLRYVFNGMNWDLLTETTFTLYFNKYFPFPKSLTDIMKGKIGGCETTTFFTITAMRSAGLPVVSDFIPEWGNVNSGHYMIHLLDKADTLPRITNENGLVNTWSKIEWTSHYDEHRHHFTQDELPPGMTLQYVWTVPKVYRYTFSVDSQAMEISRSIPQSEIYPGFRDANFRDVTSEFVECGDFMLRLPAALKKYRLAYLCAFDIDGWKPVAQCRVNHDSLLFRNIGKNIVYLPAVYEKKELRPAGAPFFLDSSGLVHALQKGGARRQNMRLVRKTAFFPYTAYHSEIVKGGKFEGCDEAGFNHPVLLDSIEKYPFYMTELTVKNPKHYRYLRYVAPHTEIQEADNIAEVQFYEDGNPEALQGIPIGSEGSPGHGIEKAFDNDWDSYYENKASKNGWIGIDLGETSMARVTRIRFCPRNDTNCIIPGQEYELFYWDGEWISLGIQKAESDHLDYTSVPSGALYWLRCNSGGHEERIFTYEKGMQRWW